MSENLPSVSIVMPVYNEADFIRESLGAALAQDYPHNKLEVLIADGMSTDDTVTIIAQMADDRVRVVPNPARRKSEGLNTIIPQATGDFVVRLDGHTIIAPDYVRQCVRAWQATGADNVGGAMNPVGITPMGKAIAAAGKSPFAVPTPFHVSDEPQFTDTVYMGAWPRTVFERVGYFNTDLPINQDYEFNYRIRQSGGKIYLDPAIKSQYFSRQTWRELWRQYHRYGRGKVQMLKQHPAALRPRQVVAPLFVAGLVIGLPLSGLIPPLVLVYVLAIVAYISLSVIFGRRVLANSTECVALWRVLLVFATMHIAWGSGFWRELFIPGKL